MLKSIMGKIVDSRETYRRARVLKPSGFGKAIQPKRFTGYHRQMDRAEMVALTIKLQRQASR